MTCTCSCNRRTQATALCSWRLPPGKGCLLPVWYSMQVIRSHSLACAMRQPVTPRLWDPASRGQALRGFLQREEQILIHYPNPPHPYQPLPQPGFSLEVNFTKSLGQHKLHLQLGKLNVLGSALFCISVPSVC